MLYSVRQWAAALVLCGVFSSLAYPALAQCKLSAFVQVWYTGPYNSQPIRDLDMEDFGAAESYTYGRYGRDDWDIRTNFQGEAQARATFGSLSAYARGDLRQDDYVWATNHLANASATFEDTLTISRDGGGTGYVVYWMQLSGFATGSFDRGDAEGALRLQHDGVFDYLASECTGSQLVCSSPYPVTFGKPYSLRVSLDAYVSIISSSFPYRGSGLADFTGQAELAGIQVIDSRGTPLTDYTVKSASGTAYPVPEPGGAAALLTGLVCLAIRRWRGCAGGGDPGQPPG